MMSSWEDGMEPDLFTKEDRLKARDRYRPLGARSLLSLSECPGWGQAEAKRSHNESGFEPADALKALRLIRPEKATNKDTLVHRGCPTALVISL